MLEYWKKIYSARYFWLYLAKSDIVFKYRRSKMGMLWMILQPLMYTMILAGVFSVAFKQPLGEYAMYILSGIVVWNLIQSSFVSGGNSFIISEQYIRQFNHPKTIYTLRFSLVYVYTFFVEMVALVLWILFVKPSNLVFGIITLPLTTVLFFGISWGVVTIAAYTNTKYRDYPQLMSLLMQALYYVSPVFFKQEMFTSSKVLETVLNINPITHVLNLIRQPFIYGEMPSVVSYLYVIFVLILVDIIAWIINSKNEKNIIFYL